MKKILNHPHFGLPSYVWLVMVIFSILILLPAITKQHLFYNLEPYPDTFTYVMPSWNLANGNGFLLEFQGSSLRPNIISSYSLFLTSAFVFWHDPRVILVVNAALFASSFAGLYLVMKQLKIHPLLTASGLGLYCLHGALLWISSLALTENVAITAVVLSILLVIKFLPSNSYRSQVFLMFVLGVLFFARLSLLPLAVGLWAIVLIESLQAKKWRSAVLLGAGLLVTLTLFESLQLWMRENPLNVVATQLSVSTPLYYSLSYFWPNTQFYLAGYMGAAQTTMWLIVPLTGLGVSVLALGGVLTTLRCQRRTGIILLVGGLLQLSTLMVFYHQDHRYLLATLPVLVICLSLFLQALYQNQKRRLAAGLFICAAASLVWAQKDFYKLLIADTVFLRSTPWQYQAVQNFNHFFSDHSGVVVTALPPYLFELFQQNAYTVLPLSSHQEYLSKGRHSWGEGIDYADLTKEYKARLSQGQVVYISNAYITHSQQVIQDFEQYKQSFGVQLVQEGCLSACNIYQLQLLPETSKP